MTQESVILNLFKNSFEALSQLGPFYSVSVGIALHLSDQISLKMMTRLFFCQHTNRLPNFKTVLPSDPLEKSLNPNLKNLEFLEKLKNPLKTHFSK